ncbi:protease htpX [Methanobacterium petrolearium]|uniref:protease htpX n=1 Tax=Methanobacterium petrolearium TaxID=710190 RepID=UPI001AE218A0|nr:protease htpX [Methanobacterium petrolearium]MBP1945045.1 heat shock protein HtpX [Methanobacterium petrolearium]BDZ70373.1 hypothetical protein GCM10025861_08900 [Methanobacterium petrolearium]
MVSNDEIKRKLAEKRNPGVKKSPSSENLAADRTLSSEELKDKFRKQREKQKDLKHENPGYLICEKCGGYYELQPGESPDDFTDECECGGKLEYVKTLKTS